MKRNLILSVLSGILALSSCVRPASVPDPPYASGKPYTRWWWFSAEIDQADVRDQLAWLKDHGFGGVEIAWVYPMFLDTARAHPAFLSEDWSEAVAYAKRTADSLGLGCDFTYGTLWPFNDVDLPAGDQTRTYFDSVEVACRAYTWDHPAVARILNHLDRNAFRRYADKMNRGLGRAYAGSPSALFVDSWEVETDYLWTPGFGEAFQARYGYDIEPYMRQRTLMDRENSDVLYDYMDLLSDYVLEDFYGPFAENARATGNFSRAQCGGAPTDLLTAFSLVDIPETEAILYEPGFSKIAASAATWAGQAAVTAETFTCLYGWTGLRYQDGHGQSPHQGEEQIADLKLVCDALFANGTNQIIWHGFPYNKVGETANWFYTTCQVSTNPADNLTGDALTAFNRYMTTVSRYMRKGRNYTDLAVYLPLEDAWLGGPYPEEITRMMPWALGEYEMRYVRTPEEFKGMQPLWVNGRFLSEADYRDGLLRCGDALFSGLYVDARHLSYETLQALMRLARSGLPVCLATAPVEPGVNKHPDYAALVEGLYALPGVSADPSILAHPALVEGGDLPDFWCRQEGDTLYIFFANPLSRTVTYPMEYGYAFTDPGSTVPVTVNHHGRSEPYTLVFRPRESLLLEVTAAGIRPIDLDFIPGPMAGLVPEDPQTSPSV